jgi:hypothetical protein
MYNEFIGKEALEKQKLASEGDLINPYSSHVLSASEVAAYNRYTMDFNNTRQRDVQEFLLDQRHKFFVACQGQSKNKSIH